MKNNIKRNKLIYIIVFILLNILNTYLITANRVFKGINPYPVNFFMIVNSFIGDLGFIILFLAFAILVFKTDYGRSKYLMIVSIVLSLVFFSTSIYIQYYETFFSFYNLQTFGMPGGGDALGFLLKALPGLIIKAKLVFLLPALVIIILFILFFRRNRKNSDFVRASIVKGTNRIYISVLLFAIGILMMGNSLNSYFFDKTDTWYEDNATTIHGIQAAGFFNYYFYDAYSYFFSEDVFPEEKLNSVLNKLNEEYKTEQQKSPIDDIIYANNSNYNGLFAGKNLILIQVESLNNFVIGLTININGEQVEVTPNLNRILSQSVYFDNYYHAVGIGNTSDAEFTNLIGLTPIAQQFTVFRYNEVQYETLPNLFREKGYFSFSVHGNNGFFYERAKTHPKIYGFDLHYSEEQLNVTEEDLLHTWLNDVEMLKQTVDLMKLHSDQGPIFTFPITISNHTPYNKPIESKDESWFKYKENLFPNGFEVVDNFIQNNEYIGYLEHVSFTDYALGEMFKYLEEQALAEDTIIMLYGDHGCGLDIYNMFYEKPELFSNEINKILLPIADPIEQSLAERGLKQNIPFIIFDPSGNIIYEGGVLEPQTISLVRGTNSTARTISNLFDLNPEYYFGVDALSNAKTFAYNPRNFDIFIDGAIISEQSGDYYVFDDDYLEIYTEKKIQDIIKAFQEYKDFNDKLLKYKVFPLLD